METTKKIKLFTAEGIHAKTGFDLGEQIARSRNIEETVLSGDDKALSVGVGVFAVSSLAGNLRVLSGKGHRKAGCGKSAYPFLRGGEIFSLFHSPQTVKFEQ